MSSQTTKIITVFGATGHQGASVIASLLRNPAFAVRGTTRNVSSEGAQALTAKGVQLFTVDAVNPDADQLEAALKGAWGVFLNLSSHDPSIEENEYAAGKAMIDAIQGAGVEHIVYSSLPPSSLLTSGEVPMATFDEKYKLQQYISNSCNFATASFIQAAWYFDNFKYADFSGGFPFVPGADGVYTLRYPSCGPNLPLVAIENDFGDWVHGILLEPEAWNGKVVQGSSAIMSYQEMVERFETYTGKKARVDEISVAEFETFGLSWMEEIAKMFTFFQKTAGRYYGVENDLGNAKKLKAAVAEKVGGKATLTTWEEWLAENWEDKEKQ